MKNKFSFWPIFLSVSVLGLAGFWGMAYWSSPEHSREASRSTASLSTAKLLKLAKQNQNMPKRKVKPAQRTPANKGEWFQDSRKKVYQGRTYLVSRDVRALAQEDYEHNAEVLERRDGWVFFKASSEHDQAFRLWQDTNNHEMLIETGRLLVSFNSMSDFRGIQNLYDFKVVYQAPGRPLFLLRFEGQENIDQIIEELKRAPGVSKIERELIGPPVQTR